MRWDRSPGNETTWCHTTLKLPRVENADRDLLCGLPCQSVSGLHCCRPQSQDQPIRSASRCQRPWPQHSKGHVHSGFQRMPTETSPYDRVLLHCPNRSQHRHLEPKIPNQTTTKALVKKFKHIRLLITNRPQMQLGTLLRLRSSRVMTRIFNRA